MRTRTLAISAACLLALTLPAFADAIAGAAPKQALNYSAIAMFGMFVLLTLAITFWAAKRTKSAAQYYAAGGGITGLQNGLAIAGDYMSAASFLGISGLVYKSGYDEMLRILSRISRVCLIEWLRLGGKYNVIRLPYEKNQPEANISSLAVSQRVKK